MRLFSQVRRRLFIFQMMLLLIGSCAVAYGALKAFERDLRPEMTRKSDLIAGSLAQQFQRALALGDSFERLRGVEELFGSMRAENPEVVFILAADEDHGRVFYDGKAKRSIALDALDASCARRDAGPRPDALIKLDCRYGGRSLGQLPDRRAADYLGRKSGWPGPRRGR